MNEDEYIVLYRRAYNRTCAVFHKKGFSPEDCQDLAQEVFLEIWRDRAKSYAAHISFWHLKVALILQRAKSKLHVSPLDALVSVRNIDEHPHLGGRTEPLDEQEEIVFEDFLRNLPKAVQGEVRLLLSGFTYGERRVILKKNTAYYKKIRDLLMEDPQVQEYIRDYVRS